MLKNSIRKMLILSILILLVIVPSAFAEKQDNTQNKEDIQTQEISVTKTEANEYAKLSFNKSNLIEYKANGGIVVLDIEDYGKFEFGCYGVVVKDGKASKSPIPTVISIKKEYKSVNTKELAKGLTYLTTLNLSADPDLYYGDDCITGNMTAEVEIWQDEDHRNYYDLNRTEHWLERNILELSVQDARIFSEQYGLVWDTGKLKIYDYSSPVLDSSLWDDPSDLEGHHYIRTEGGTYVNWRPVRVQGTHHAIMTQWRGDVYYEDEDTGLSFSDNMNFIHFPT